MAALPFLALGVAALFASAGARWRRAMTVTFAILALYSVALMVVATAVRPEVPTWYDDPYSELLFPSFLRGELGVNTIPIHTGFVHEQRQAWNLGEKLGLRGLMTLVPLALFVAATGAWLVRALRPQGARTTS